MISNITLSTDASWLEITSNSGDTACVTASLLRSEAKDAASRRERIENGFVSVQEGIRITAIVPMGSTGINIQFSDGHKKAIYPNALLGKIAFPTDN